jgi:hypothetical protein
MADFAQIPERVQKTGNSLLATQPERWKSLRERFAWCAIAVWTQLTDDDVDDFVEVKKIRDLLAHGEITAPPAAAVLLIERISAKLQTAT